MNTVVLEFEFEKSTPGTHKFKEVGPSDGSRPIVGTLYVTKTAMPTAPVRLRMTLDAVE